MEINLLRIGIYGGKNPSKKMKCTPKILTKKNLSLKFTGKEWTNQLLADNKFDLYLFSFTIVEFSR